MPSVPAAAIFGAAAVLVVAVLSGCSRASAADMQAGDCLKIGGTARYPDTSEAMCGSRESNYKVISTVTGSGGCPADVDSSYTLNSAFSDETQTVCMDVDWVVGGCMSIDPEHTKDPVRVDCTDSGALHRQRASQILRGVSAVDQCGSGIGYPYPERQFTVCVEDVA